MEVPGAFDPETSAPTPPKGADLDVPTLRRAAFDLREARLGDKPALAHSRLDPTAWADDVLQLEVSFPIRSPGGWYVLDWNEIIGNTAMCEDLSLIHI